MPQPKKGARLGSNPKHQSLMLSNLALSLFEHERIRTTEAKAKLLRPYAERLITKAKKGDVHNRRQVLSLIEDRTVVHKLFSDIAPRFADRSGGYTRILKLGPRNGDGAPMALIELVEEGEVAVTRGDEEEGGRRRARRPIRRRREGGLPEDKPVRSKAAQASAEGDEDFEEEEISEAGEAAEEAAEASAEAAIDDAEQAETATGEEEGAQSTSGGVPEGGLPEKKE